MTGILMSIRDYDAHTGEGAYDDREKSPTSQKGLKQSVNPKDLRFLDSTMEKIHVYC